MGLRIAKAFENHIDDERGWHTQLIKRLSLEIPGIRPALKGGIQSSLFVVNMTALLPMLPSQFDATRAAILKGDLISDFDHVADIPV